MSLRQPSSQRPFKVLQGHNYHAHRGGSEVMFETTVELLRAQRHEVAVVQRDNRDITTFGDKLSAFRQCLSSRTARAEVARILRHRQPDIAHFHNLYPLLSPSVLEACHQARVPVVLSCHDYKLTCPTAQHLRRGATCEDCLGGNELRCALHNCRGNLLLSVAYAARDMVARYHGQIRDTVSLFLTPTRFAKQQLVKGGYPAERIEVLGNMVEIPADDPGRPTGDYIAYVGRISREKGIETLLEAARATGVPVRIAGDPSLMPQLVRSAPANVRFVGQLERHELPAFYGAARALVVPSVWFEVFGIVCGEAMGYGLPVIASRIGGLPEVVEDGVTGLLFEPGNSNELADTMQRVWDSDALFHQLGHTARQQAVQRFSPQVHYQQLVALYCKALEVRHGVDRSQVQRSFGPTHELSRGGLDGPLGSTRGSSAA
ncbi:MAG: glycosyltransferase [Acidobacteriota bacterium]